MYLLEAKGEKAFELMADLFDPISDIAADAQILKCIQTNQKAKAIKFAMRDHAKEMTKILALCDGVDPNDYNKTAPEMLADVMTVVNHPMVAGLFQSQDQSTEASSGSATETTLANGTH